MRWVILISKMLLRSFRVYLAAMEDVTALVVMKFCVVIQNRGGFDLEERLKELELEQQEFNQSHTIPKIQIAYGFAGFDAEKDMDFEAARSRADVKMYEKKRALKGGGR